MTLNDIINLTPDKLNKLTAKELKPLIQQMNSAVNKQVKRLNTSDVANISPALHELNRSGGTALTTRGKNINELRSEFTRGRNFLSNPTRTVGGVAKYRENIRTSIKDSTGVDISSLSNRQIGKVFTALHKFKEKYPAFYTPDILEKITDATEQFPDKRRLTPDRLLEIVEQDLLTDYEESESEYMEAFDDDEFFEWE